MQERVASKGAICQDRSFGKDLGRGGRVAEVGSHGAPAPARRSPVRRSLGHGRVRLVGLRGVDGVSLPRTGTRPRGFAMPRTRACRGGYPGAYVRAGLDRELYV